MSTEQCHERFVTFWNCDNVRTCGRVHIRTSGHTKTYRHPQMTTHQHTWFKHILLVYSYMDKKEPKKLFQYPACWWFSSWHHHAISICDFDCEMGIQINTHVLLQWRHNKRDDVANQRRLYCLLSRLFRGRSKKTTKLCAIGLCEGNSPGTGEFPAQRASDAENLSIWWRHHVPESHCTKWILS